MWIVGIGEGDVSFIEIPKGYEVPHPSMKSLIKTIKLSIPFLDLVPQENGDRSLVQIDEILMREHLMLEQENYRKSEWEYLKHFRTKYDNEYTQTESIMSSSDIINKKKELDKTILDSVRICIINEEHEKVFSYIDQFSFT